MIESADHSGTEQAAGVVALVFLVPFVILLVAMAVRWRAVKRTNSRAEAIEAALGRRGARVFWIAYMLCLVTLLGVGAAIAIEHARGS